MLTIHTLVVGELQTNCYFITDAASHTTLIVDPADAPEYISDVLIREALTPIGVAATHGHFDHLLGAFGLQVTYNIPFYIHADDTFLLNRMQASGKHFLKRQNIDPAPVMTQKLTDGHALRIGKESIRILHTPGHTPGSVAFIVPSAQAALVGDALFADGSVGRTDASYASAPALRDSIERIVRCPDVRTLYPGHGNPLSVDRAAAMFGV